MNNGDRPLRVLLVDDEEPIRAMMRIAFSVEDGVGEVREAGSGAAAIEMCHEFEPDLIFLDYWMPEMDGSVAASKLRELFPSARIVAFSGVLHEKPTWADDLCIKGDMPDLELVIDLTRAELSA